MLEWIIALRHVRQQLSLSISEMVTTIPQTEMGRKAALKRLFIPYQVLHLL